MDLAVEWVRGESVSAPYSSGSEPPHSAAPAGAVDTHHHVFSNRFLDTSGTPVRIEASVDDYRAFKQRLGISRSIVVAPSSYGTDNACLVDALDQLGTDAARGVALVDPDIGDDALDELGRHGVRGLRVYLAKNRVPTAEELRSLGKRAADRNWVLQFVGNREREVFPDWVEVMAELPCPLVIDHFGWAPQPGGIASATADAIRRLMDTGKGFAKLSGLYLSSRVGPPDYPDVDDLAVDLVRHAPEQVLWGSDWPHAISLPYIPDGALLFDKLAAWAPDDAIRRQILVTNPERLFWSD
jgi:predicted TIM-barrel fold metal-dependent hydrolase